MSRINSQIRGKNWTFTYNWNDQEERLDPAPLIMRWKEQLDWNGDKHGFAYICGGKEKAPTTGQIHIQGYFELYTSHSLAFLKNNLSKTAHFEQAKGNRKQNIEYCSKEKDLEHGIFYEENQLGWEMDKLKEKYDAKKLQFYKDCRLYSMIELEQMYPTAVFEKRARIMEWRMNMPIKNDYSGLLKRKNFWIWGPTGVGKSRWVRQQGMTIYEKNLNKWWNGYDNQEIVVLEDFPIGEKARIMFDYIKIWSDRYTFVGELKNSHMRICPGQFKFIVTANHSIEETFSGIPDEDIKAIKRRFNEVEIKSEEDAFLQTRLN